MKRLVNRLSGACLYVLLALIVGMSSCEDDANDWTVNKNYDALFRPLTFDKSATDATSVTLRYSTLIGVLLSENTVNVSFRIVSVLT